MPSDRSEESDACHVARAARTEPDAREVLERHVGLHAAPPLEAVARGGEHLRARRDDRAQQDHHGDGEQQREREQEQPEHHGHRRPGRGAVDDEPAPAGGCPSEGGDESDQQEPAQEEEQERRRAAGPQDQDPSIPGHARAAVRATSTIRPKVCSRSCDVVSSPVTTWSLTVQIASARAPCLAASVYSAAASISTASTP